jgi:Zn-finger nucleic acid-binding protein
MKCPRTGTKMERVVIDGIEIDLSLGCGGVWFDGFELEKFDEVHEKAGEILANHMQQYHQALDDPDARLKCPRDTNVVMMRHYYSPKQQIEIDECPQCGGVWLDAEELSAIRELFPTQEHLELAGNKFVQQVMESPEVKNFEQQSKELPNKLNKISNVLWSIVRFGF